MNNRNRQLKNKISKVKPVGWHNTENAFSLNNEIIEITLLIKSKSHL